jgi:N-acetylneuraminic acid mutarotase
MKWVCLALTCLIFFSIFFPNLLNTEATQPAAENTWETLPSLPEPLGHGIAVTVEEKIYLFYGANLFEYDIPKQNLTQKTTIPTQRSGGYGLAVVGDKIYTIGGQGAPGQGPTNINEAYDTTTGTWETKQPAIDGTYFIANVVNGKIYATTYSYMDVYDPETDNWTRISALPQDVKNPSCSYAIDDKIYTIEDNTAATTIGEGKLYIYDTTTDTWSTGATLPTFYKESRMVATTGAHAPKQIYLVGGEIIHGIGDFDGVNATFRYDPVSDSWSGAADMPTARGSVGVAVVDDKIYAIGGVTGPGATIFEGKPTSAVEVYTPFGYGTMQASASPSNSTNPWLVLPDATAVIVGVAVGAAIAGTVIAATAKIINHRKHPETAKQSKPSN